MRSNLKIRSEAPTPFSAQALRLFNAKMTMDDDGTVPDNVLLELNLLNF